jgi:hypothetical protein
MTSGNGEPSPAAGAGTLPALATRCGRSPNTPVPAAAKTIGGMTTISSAARRTAATWRTAAFFGALLLTAALAPAATSAQAPTDRNAVRLEISYLAAAISYSRRASDAWFFGGGAGLGIEVLQAAASPVRHSDPTIRHAEIVHVRGFASWTPSASFRTDIGMRVALMYYGRDHVNSAGFAGPYVAPAVGTRRVKVSSRAQVGYLHSRHGSGLALLVQPVNFSVAFPW